MSLRCGRGNHIHDERAYAAAVQRRIFENARKSREAKWFSEGEDRPALVARLRAAAERKGGFFLKMAESLEQYGSLSPKQESAIRDIFARDDAKKAEAKARDATSRHIGEIGKRETFLLTVRAVASFESDYGMVYVHVMADATGNIVVHKGASIGEYDASETWLPITRGDRITLAATVKTHGERDGALQTVVARPKLKTIERETQ
jgi:hypothetical protein